MSPANFNHQRHATNHVNHLNPIFQREELPTPRNPSIEMNEAAQMGQAPLPTTESPLLNTPEELIPVPEGEAVQEASPIAPAGTIYLDEDHAHAVGVSDGEKIVPINLELTPYDQSTGRPINEEEDDDEDEGPAGTTGAETQQAQSQAPAAVPDAAPEEKK